MAKAVVGPLELPVPLNKKEHEKDGAIFDIDAKDVGCARPVRSPSHPTLQRTDANFCDGLLLAARRTTGSRGTRTWCA